MEPRNEAVSLGELGFLGEELQVSVDRRVVAFVTSDEQVGTITGVAISRAATAMNWYCNVYNAA